jgi:hypothetical protein
MAEESTQKTRGLAKKSRRRNLLMLGGTPYKHVKRGRCDGSI